MITNIEFQCNPAVGSSLKFRESISGVRSTGAGGMDFRKIKKKNLGKEANKTHSKFHHDQTSGEPM